MPALDREQVARAVKALLQHERAPKPGEKRKAQLFEDTAHKVLSLVVGMKEQPRKERTKAYPIRIPHSLHAESEICILVKDPQKKLKERLESEPVDGVVKIIGLRKLRDNYKTFEAKRNLCDSYDLFMADRRILPMLPKLLQGVGGGMLRLKVTMCIITRFSLIQEKTMAHPAVLAALTENLSVRDL